MSIRYNGDNYYTGYGGKLLDISPITENGTYRTYNDLILVDKFICDGNGYFITDILGETSSTIYFDLANHLTINGVVYNRNPNHDDYDNWYFGFTNDDSGVTYYIDNYTGNVGDAVYSKSGDTYVATVEVVTAIA